jgi:hypothetical protein
MLIMAGLTLYFTKMLQEMILRLSKGVYQEFNVTHFTKKLRNDGGLRYASILFS